MGSSSGGYRIGADVGGTFTDVVIETPDGSFESTKVLTTHQGPEIGILEGITRIADQHGINLTQVEQIIHGTTLATNALIERRGAKTALVTTKGFRDVIETRTEGRFEQYDLNIVLPTPLIERKDRFVVTERLNATRSKRATTRASLLASSTRTRTPITSVASATCCWPACPRSLCP